MHRNNKFSFLINFFNNDFSSMSRFDGFTSTNITLPPDIFTALAVAGKEILGIITSSPFFIPAAFKARNKAAVPLVVATAYLTFNNLQIFFSKILVSFPSLIKLLFKTEFKFFLLL